MTRARKTTRLWLLDVKVRVPGAPPIVCARDASASSAQSWTSALRHSGVQVPALRGLCCSVDDVLGVAGNSVDPRYGEGSWPDPRGHPCDPPGLHPWWTGGLPPRQHPPRPSTPTHQRVPHRARDGAHRRPQRGRLHRGNSPISGCPGLRWPIARHRGRQRIDRHNISERSGGGRRARGEAQRAARISSRKEPGAEPGAGGRGHRPGHHPRCRHHSPPFSPSSARRPARIGA